MMKMSKVKAVYLRKLCGANITAYKILVQNSLIARMDDTLPRPYNKVVEIVIVIVISRSQSIHFDHGSISSAKVRIVYHTM